MTSRILEDMTITDALARQAASYLAQADCILAPVIARAGTCPLRQHRNYYQELVRSIIGQQLSLKAAAAIEARLLALFQGEFPSPAELLAVSPDSLREAGFSRSKVGYVKDLAARIVEGTLPFDTFDRLDNKAITAELTAIKGVGEWTAHMFLMFCMARSDVLAVGDLGIRNGIRLLYGLDHQPTAEEVTLLAGSRGWQPYETIACWYVWRSLEVARP